MQLEFYYDSIRSDRKLVEKITSKLKKLKGKVANIKSVDICNETKDKRYDLYSKTWTPSVFKKYRIRKVFGTQRNPGTLFGEVPALLVYDDSDNFPSDVYPHDKHGKVETIEEYLNSIT